MKRKTALLIAIVICIIAIPLYQFYFNIHIESKWIYIVQEILIAAIGVLSWLFIDAIGRHTDKGIESIKFFNLYALEHCDMVSYVLESDAEGKVILEAKNLGRLTYLVRHTPSLCDQRIIINTDPPPKVEVPVGKNPKKYNALTAEEIETFYEKLEYKSRANA